MREIKFNAFDMNCIVHQSPGLWRHPDDHARDYNKLKYWTELAKTLEKGLFDGIFIADVLGPYDVYQNSSETVLKSGVQVPVNDPMLLVSAIATVTNHLSIGVTAGTSYEHPHPFARRLATLDHLTEGRFGWNVVTGYLPSAARNMGFDDLLEHDTRYDHADEYLEVIYKLLEGSWEDEAVICDDTDGLVVDPSKVHDIDHNGRWFKVPGAAVTEPSPQRTPLIFQAGSSPRGLEFAARHAEASFISGPTDEVIRESVKKLRTALLEAGRGENDVKVFSLHTVVTGATNAEAEEKYRELASYVDIDGALSLLSGWFGIDLAEYGYDQLLGDVQSNAVQSAVTTFKKISRDNGEWTIRKMAEWVGIGGFGPVTVGSGETVAQKLAEFQDATDVDGFNLAYHITPGTFEDIVEFVVPELQKLGRYKTEYADGTLRNKLFGRGDRLDKHHAGAQYSMSRR